MRRKRRNMAMNEKPKILIADDSEINRALLSLNKYGARFACL